jgi:hypothetical protein
MKPNQSPDPPTTLGNMRELGVRHVIASRRFPVSLLTAGKVALRRLAFQGTKPKKQSLVAT